MPGSSGRSVYRATGSSPKSLNSDRVEIIDSIAQSWLVFKQGAELAQAFQCLIFGIKDRKNGKEPHDVKDLLDRFL